MSIIIVMNVVSPNYIPQIIGVVGTILGAITGWLLQSISTNRTKIYFDLDYYCDQKADREYAYITKLFVYNASYKNQCMRNVRLCFKKSKSEEVFISLPCLGECTFDTIRHKYKGKKEIGILSVGSYDQCEFVFSDLILDMNYDKLSEVRNIYLLYENKKNHTKKILVKKIFDLNSVEKCKTKKFL